MIRLYVIHTIKAVEEKYFFKIYKIFDPKIVSKQEVDEIFNKEFSNLDPRLRPSLYYITDEEFVDTLVFKAFPGGNSNYSPGPDLSTIVERIKGDPPSCERCKFVTDGSMIKTISNISGGDLTFFKEPSRKITMTLDDEDDRKNLKKYVSYLCHRWRDFLDRRGIVKSFKDDNINKWYTIRLDDEDVYDLYWAKQLVIDDDIKDYTNDNEKFQQTNNMVRFTNDQNTNVRLTNVGFEDRDTSKIDTLTQELIRVREERDKTKYIEQYLHQLIDDQNPEIWEALAYGFMNLYIIEDNNGQITINKNLVGLPDIEIYPYSPRE